jgi:hypothetical protein
MPEPITPVVAPVTPAAPVTPIETPATQAAAKPDPVADDPLNKPSNLTNKQVNDLIARDATKEARKLLADAGLDSTGDLKADLAKLKSIRDSQLTDDQKRAERDKEIEGKMTTAQREASEAKAEAAALKAGVPADKAERVRKLALAGDYEGATEAEKVAAVLSDFPEFVKKEAPGDVGRLTKGSQVNEEEALLAQMKKNAGIK